MIKAPTETPVLETLRRKPTYTHGMDGATVAVRCEGLPDDVIERLQRKVMEQARELSALRKSEAAAQAELDRALLGSPGRARSPSPDRALRRRRGASARLDAEKRPPTRGRGRRAERPRKTPGPRKKLADAEAAPKRAAAPARDADRAEACAAAADAKRACHGRLDALEGRVQQPSPPARPRRALRRRGRPASCGRGRVRALRADRDAAAGPAAAAHEAAGARSLAAPGTSRGAARDRPGGGRLRRGRDK